MKIKVENLFNGLFGPAGSGKAVPNEEIIMTPQGPIQMSQIEVGDYVIARNGTPTEVTKVYKQNDLEIYRLYFSDGTSVECCIDHYWTVQTHKMKKNGKYATLSLKEMLPKIQEPRKSTKEGFYYSIPLSDPVHFTPLPIPIQPYLLGYLLGNGHLPITGMVNITTHVRDKEEVFLSCQDDRYTLALLDSPCYQNKVGKIHLYKSIQEPLENLGLLGRKARDKFIPNLYLYNSVEVRKELLAGLLDSDGSVSVIEGRKRKSRFDSTSLPLIEGVAFLVRSLGGLASYSESKARPGEYRLSFRLPFCPFKLRRKATLYNSVSNFYSFSKGIVRAEYVGLKDGRCIDVSDSEHLFLLKDFIVTHNSTWINEQLKTDPRFCLKTSSTGISAINLGGTTINSTLNYFDTNDLLIKVQDGTIFRTLKRIAREFSSLLIDEVSMVSAQQLDLLCHMIRVYNHLNPKLPLGLWVVGDLGQLSIVTKGSEKSLIHAKHWSQFNVRYLTDIKRQTDPEFGRALMMIRAGRVKEVVDWFEAEVGFHRTIDPDFTGSTIFTTNSAVDAFNQKQLAKIEATTFSYPKVIVGKPKAEWSNIPSAVVLKPGCVGILLANKIPEYANGDICIVEELFTDSVLIKIVRTNKVYVLSYKELDHIDRASGARIGTIRFLPIRVGYGSTVHRCQSLTLDAVQVRVSDSFYRVLHGGLYVALSRARTKEGLRLVGTKDDLIKAAYVSPEFAPFVEVPPQYER